MAELYGELIRRTTALIQEGKEAGAISFASESIDMLGDALDRTRATLGFPSRDVERTKSTLNALLTPEDYPKWEILMLPLLEASLTRRVRDSEPGATNDDPHSESEI